MTQERQRRDRALQTLNDAIEGRNAEVAKNHERELKGLEERWTMTVEDLTIRHREEIQRLRPREQEEEEEGCKEPGDQHKTEQSKGQCKHEHAQEESRRLRKKLEELQKAKEKQGKEIGRLEDLLDQTRTEVRARCFSLGVHVTLLIHACMCVLQMMEDRRQLSLKLEEDHATSESRAIDLHQASGHLKEAQQACRRVTELELGMEAAEISNHAREEAAEDPRDESVQEIEQEMARLRAKLERARQASSSGKSGELEKKGNNFITPWQSRYFVATGHTFKYYGSKEASVRGEDPHKSFDLRELMVNYNEGGDFELIYESASNNCGDGEIHLRATDTRGARDWVHGLGALQGRPSNKKIPFS